MPSQASLSSAVAMTGMTGAINRATDCIHEMKGLLNTNLSPLSISIPAGTPPQTFPQNSLPTPPNAFPKSGRGVASQAAQILMRDVGVDPTIRAQLVLAFLTNSSLCQIYIDLTDPTVREAFTISWFQQNHTPQLSPAPVLLPPSTSTTTFPATAFLPGIGTSCATAGEVAIAGVGGVIIFTKTFQRLAY
jgi:hypothetical protein